MNLCSPRELACAARRPRTTPAEDDGDAGGARRIRPRHWETRPEYVDAVAARRAGHPDVLAAPTFLFCLTIRGDDPWAWAREGGLDMTRTLHGEQSFAYHRLVHAGDRLTFSATTDTPAPASAGLRRLSRRTRVSGVDGEVATLVTTLVMREART